MLDFDTGGTRQGKEEIEKKKIRGEGEPKICAQKFWLLKKHTFGEDMVFL